MGGTVFYKSQTHLPWLFRFLPSTILALLLLAPASFAARSVTLAWDPSPESNLAGYRLKYGNSSGSYTQTVDVGNTTSATVPELLEGNTYYFTVTAINSSSMESVPSNEVSVTVTVSVNQPPSVALTSPVDGGSAVAPATISLSANAADSDGTVSRVEFYNGATKLGEDTSSPFTYQFNVTSAGSYTFTAKAFDNQGLSTQSGGISITVTVPPPASFSPGSISSVTFNPGSGVQLVVSGTPGQTQSVYVSNDLKTWSLLTSATNANGTLSCLLYTSPSPRD